MLKPLDSIAPAIGETSAVVDGVFGPPQIEARGLVFERNGRNLINDIDLTLSPNRRTVIMGANGSGKSLLLRLLHGLLRPTRGTILWQGRPLDRIARDAQAMVFQKPVMLRRSVVANLSFALKVRGVRGRARDDRVAEALDMAHLADLGDRPARVLSGGEQQRLAIARALICRPELLFLDEPSASLDPASTARIEDLVQAAHAAGITIVLVTHDKGQAKRLADDIVFLHAGQVAERGPASRLLENPRSEAAQAWLDGRLYF